MQNTNGELKHSQGINASQIEMSFAEKWADRILPQIRETHRRGFWINLFRTSEEAVVVNSVEETEQALVKGGIENRAAYFARVFRRHHNASKAPMPAGGA